MTDGFEAVVTASEMDQMSPQQRADLIDAAIVRSWDDVPASFKAEVLETASVIGRQRRERV